MGSVDQVTNLHKNNEVQYLCFRLEKNGELYAVNVFKVQEILKYPKTPTRLPSEEGSLLEGLITVRNITIPLVDMKKWFFFDPERPNVNLDSHGIDEKIGQIMLCDFSGIIIGIRIYEAERIITKKWEDVHPAVQISTNPKNSKINNNTRHIDGQLIQIVDIEKMVGDLMPNEEETIHKELDRLPNIDTSKIVLVAEDSPLAIKLLGKILTHLGVTYKHFENGKTLLAYMNSPAFDPNHISLIISDLEMPEVSGFEVIKQVRANKRFSNIPIAVNSSMSGSSNSEMALSLGADDFIQKTQARDVERIVRAFCVKK